MQLDGLHVMVDLETLGTSNNSVILTLGAARFTKDAVLDTFYRRIDPHSCLAAGLVMDLDTIRWWMSQSDDARAAAFAKGEMLPDVLNAFTSWYQQGACLWGNGATFDNVLLASAYKACNLKTPWPYWGDRCYRTLKNLYPQVTADKFEGVQHNALDDAVHQAKHVIKIMATV